MESTPNLADSINNYKRQLMNFYAQNYQSNDTPVTQDNTTIENDTTTDMKKQNDTMNNNQTQNDSMNNYTQMQNGNLSPDTLFDMYKKEHTALGKLMIKTYTARRTYPVKNALVEVSKVFPTGKYVLARTRTNESGMTQTMLLPTKRKPLTLEPGESEPYGTYTVTIFHPNFVTTRIIDVPVFDETMSVQTVDLVPPSANATGKEIIEYTAYRPNL